jgi:hypothetical protein
MNKYPLIGGSICAVVLLVLGSMSGVVGYQINNPNSSTNEKPVRIRVFESKADGTSKKTMVTISHDQFVQLQQELDGVHDSDGRFAIYQKYGLISKDVTLEKLRLGMEDRAKQLGISKGRQTLLSKLSKNSIVKGIFCKVYIYAYFIAFPLRKAIITFFDALIPIPIPSINFLVWYENVWDLTLNNVEYGFYVAQLIGFVGITIGLEEGGFYFAGCESWGFCALCLAEVPH